MEIIKVPQARIKALRGDRGSVTRMLEEKIKVSISLDKDGTVTLEGEPVDEFFALPVIKAIARGFEPRVALKLLNDEYGMKIIDLRDFARNAKTMARVRGRIIGEEGKAKKIIEDEAEVQMAIHGHTVAVIGELELIDIAATAVFKLAEGMPHGGVYLYLEKNRRRRNEERLREKAGK